MLLLLLLHQHSCRCRLWETVHSSLAPLFTVLSWHIAYHKAMLGSKVAAVVLLSYDLPGSGAYR